MSKTDESRLDTLAVNTGKTVECLLEECGLPLACACIRGALSVAYAVGLAAAKPTGWTVEIGKDKRKDTWSWTLLKGDEWLFGCSELRASQPDELQKWLAPLIDALHAKVRVVPMEKKGDAE